MKNGTRLMVSVLATTEESELQKHVFSQLRDAGFVLDVRRGSAAVLENRLRSGDFDLAFVTWFGDIDRNLRPLLASKGSYNFGRFKHRAVDTLLTQIEESSSPRDRHKLLLTLDELLRREVPFVVLPVPRSKGLAHKRVTNLLFMNGWLSIRDLELESTAK